MLILQRAVLEVKKGTTNIIYLLVVPRFGFFYWSQIIYKTLEIIHW